MYNVIECPANEHFRHPAWRVKGPGVDRFFAEEEEANELADLLRAAFHAGHLHGLKEAADRIRDFPNTESIIARRLATA